LQKQLRTSSDSVAEMSRRISENGEITARLRREKEAAELCIQELVSRVDAAETARSAAEAELEKRSARLEALERQIKEEQAFKAQMLASTDEREKKLLERVRDLEQTTYNTSGLLEAAQKEVESLRRREKELAESAARREKEYAEQIREAKESAAKAAAEIEKLRASQRAPAATGEELRKIADLESQLAAAREESKRLAEQLKARELELEKLGTEAARKTADASLSVPAGQPAQTPRTWRMRSDPQHVYGPVTLAELRDWAAQCRLSPDHEVSKDGATWVPAGSVPELRMDWMIKLADGSECGPFPIPAVRTMLDDGVIPPHTQIRHRKTGEKLQVSDLQSPAAALLMELFATVCAEAGEIERQLASALQRASRLDAELAALRRASSQDSPARAVLRHFQQKPDPNNPGAPPSGSA